MDKIQQLKASVNKLDEGFKQVKADLSQDDKYNQIFEYMWGSMNRIWESIFELESALYQHASPSNGHLPKIMGAGKMEKVLKTLGMNEDFNVEKPTIYISASQNGSKNFIAELNFPKK